ncbi:dipeptide ABC transporter ATP-binding protein [Gluconobacter albidus]|uniref:ABC transporter ATP-binding protein n=1 Tax=Gluconobacter albidus TaxID=318683 RepID=A0AAW3R0B0_9PROT|nr:ABC transporter ATP-binding protein [Gluconobacter albidus]KXV38510.1 ABC transporter ATP-binding protein [Gluconobacter albidus]GBQ88313.1 ABC transporter ATP-binding protein [Gluconobacter albidus NBRC 3250]GLQ69453.1 ABC transporter ATP-binding protein [Gluconobacter albidus]
MTSPAPVLDVNDLAIFYGDRIAVNGISFTALPGKTTALIGESGSGKSTIAKAVIRLLPPSARIDRGSITLNGQSLLAASSRTLNTIRGRQIGFIPQDPGSSLDPCIPIGRQVGEILRLHTSEGRQERRDHALTLLEKVGLPDPGRCFSQFPHELSGGMKQRVLIAIAVALAPGLIIADEPTSALDVTVQRQILDLLDRLREENGCSVLMITHDLAIARDRAHDVVVMQHGVVAERGLSDSLFSAPHSPYTRRLLRDSPAFHPRIPPARKVAPAQVPALEVSNLTITHRTHGGRTSPTVRNVSFTVQRGTTHGIIGESGSGKTTILRCLMGLIAPISGSVRIHGADAFGGRPGDRGPFRSMQLVYQNPWSSLDPRLTVRRIIEEPLRNHFDENRSWRLQRIHTLLERVHLKPDILERYPSDISGGQCQRVALARALAAEPDILVLDEFVSALDVTVQARILELLTELQNDLGLTFVFVSHDLAVVRQISDTLSIIRHGQQEEYGRAESIFSHPASDYTRTLLQAIPGKSASDCL